MSWSVVEAYPGHAYLVFHIKSSCLIDTKCEIPISILIYSRWVTVNYEILLRIIF